MNIAYKYVGTKDHHLDILRQLSIRYTQPGDLNDPHDCRPRIDPPLDLGAYLHRTVQNLPDGDRLLSLHPMDLMVRLSHLERVYRMKPFPLIANAKKNWEERFKQVGVLSLAKTNSNQTLWKRYSDSSKGFTIGLNTKLAPIAKTDRDADDEGGIRDVEYVSKRIGVPLDQIRDASCDLLFKKTTKWAVEEEIRSIRRLDYRDSEVRCAKTGNRICLWRIDPEAMVRIDIGACANVKLRETILEIVQSDRNLDHVAVYQAGNLGHPDNKMTFSRIR